MEWNEWRKKADSLYKKGSYTVKNMIRDWGFPTDLDPKEVNLLFRKGKVGTKNKKSRDASKKVNAFTRKRAEQITLPEHKNDPVNKTELRRLYGDRAAANRKSGRGSHHLDHRYSQNQLNQRTNGQGPILRNQTIKRIEAEVGHPVGQHYKNLELVTAAENQRRNEIDLRNNPPRRISKAPDRINLRNLPTVSAYMRQANKLGHIALGASALAVVNEALYGNAADAAQLAGETVIDSFNPINSGSLADGTRQGQVLTQMIHDMQNGNGSKYFPNPNGSNGTY